MRDHAHTLSDFRVPSLSIECEPCGRADRYNVAKLMEPTFGSPAAFVRLDFRRCMVAELAGPPSVAVQIVSVLMIAELGLRGAVAVRATAALRVAELAARHGGLGQGGRGERHGDAEREDQFHLTISFGARSYPQSDGHGLLPMP